MRVGGLAAICTCCLQALSTLPCSSLFPCSPSFSFFPFFFCHLFFSFFFSFFLFFLFTIISPLLPSLSPLLPIFSSYPLHPLPSPFHFYSSFFSKPQPGCLAPASWCSFPWPPSPLCSMPGGPVPLRVGGQALSPACPCAAALGTLWRVGEVSWVPSGSTSDPVPLSPQKVEEVGAWAQGGGGLAPPPFLPAPPLSPCATHFPSLLRGVGGDITLPAKELSIKIPFLPPPTPGSAPIPCLREGGGQSCAPHWVPLPSPTKFLYPS